MWAISPSPGAWLTFRWFWVKIGRIPSFFDNWKNRTNLWVMTHDFLNFLCEIIAFPLNFCWNPTFWSKNNFISGNQRYFQIISWISQNLGISTQFQNLSGNEIILKILWDEICENDHKWSVIMNFFTIFFWKLHWISSIFWKRSYHKVSKL